MIEKAHHELVKDIFYQACQLSKSQQHTFVEEQCKGNSELITEVNTLLSSYQKSAGFFSDLAKGILGTELHEDDDNVEDLNPDPYNIIGKQINHYSILSKLGDGGMGVIYQARDNRLNRVVALKFLPPSLNNDLQATKRFRREAITASSIDHTNVGTIYSVEETPQGHPFISMAYYQGDTIETKLYDGKLSIQQSLDIMCQVALGLAAAHKKDIVHRDIKPANIILLNEQTLKESELFSSSTKDPAVKLDTNKPMQSDSHTVKILDFGLAKIRDEKLTQTGIKIGTLGYMSPEHIKGEALDARSDIWSLGILFFELLSGQRPFTGTNEQSLMFALLNDEPDLSVLEVPLEIKKIVHRCLQKNPGDRYQSAEELRIALNDIQTKIQKNTLSKYPGILEKILFLRKIQKLRVAGLSAIIMIMVGAYYLQPYTIIPNSNIAENTEIELPAQKRIAVFALQTNLNDFQTGLIEQLTQTLLSLGNNYQDIWVVPHQKVQDYQLTKLEQANKTFGVNLIIDVNLSSQNEKNSIQLNLIDSATLASLKKIEIEQSTTNIASLHAAINANLLQLLDLTNSPKLVQKLTSIGTSNPQAFEAYTKASGLLLHPDKKNNINEAIQLLEVALEHDPKFLDAKAKLADSLWQLYLENKDVELANKAEEFYEKILLENPEHLSAYLTLGKLHFALGRHGTALASYQLALQYNSHNAQIYNGMANVYEKTGELELAEENLLKAINENPTYWDGYNDIGAFYLRQGRYQEAVTQFNQVISLVPDNAWGYSNLGTAYWYLGQLDKTIDNFQKSLSIRKDYALYKNLATLYFYEENYQQAAQAYANATLLNDNDYKLWGNLAGAYHHSGKSRKLVVETFKKAILLAQKNLQTLPRDIEINANLASYYAWIEESTLAKKHLSVVKESPSLTVNRYFQVAVIYELLHDSENSISWIDKALAKGFPKKYILNSPDLKKLKQTDSFKQLMAKY
ncbi:protein kinase domain-containing protein [Aliikangiella coralliicola]|uniref:Protein kinase n=1 Tax=Aliikangiella coralliicola TaxID=2592383 RepID=A0A545UGF5_9GAMM|nr:protein kinase [Aliikangiella coralliicola]TQV88483.1 protein kinase [Aliikangiella coralliicola]